jgi:hypothetical protein
MEYTEKLEATFCSIRRENSSPYQYQSIKNYANIYTPELGIAGYRR